MEKRTKIYALILLALCLAVPAVNAYTITDPVDGATYDIGSASTVDISFTRGIGVQGYYINNGPLIQDSKAVPCTYTMSLPSNSNTVLYKFGVYMGQVIVSYEFRVNYNYQEPTPEGPYLSSTLLSESNTGLTYQIKPMPDDGTYLFSRVNMGNPSAVDSTIIYSSEDAAINYIISRGTSQTFYCNYKEGYWGLPHTMSITLSAPIYSDDVLINATIVNNTLQNMPNPIKPNPTTNNNAFVSGAWSPIGRDAVVSSAFGDIVRNGGIVFSLPHMASPEELRAGLLNNTGNITAPLYDYIDSASGMVLFLPDILANAVGTVLNGISEIVSIIKDYIGYLFGLLDNCMDFFYILLPIVYALIPDAVWWCFSALLCYFIIKWILILILGYDVISAYLTDSKEGDKK